MKSIFTTLVFSLLLFCAHSEDAIQPGDIKVYVTGQIKKTGAYSVSESMAFIATITSAGGFGDFANQRAIKILRPVVSPTNEVTMKLVATVDYNLIITGKAPAPVLESGDVISISMRANTGVSPPKAPTP